MNLNRPLSIFSNLSVLPMRRASLPMAFLVLAVSSCGRELSRDDLNRERRDRATSELAPATGFFRGAVDTGTQNFTPAELIVRTKLQPSASNDTQPHLEAVMRLGFFGGVTLSTDNVSYEWTTHRLQATFTKSAGAAVELHAVVDSNGLKDVQLVGPNSGTHNFKIQYASRTAPANLDTNQTSFEKPLGFALSSRVDGGVLSGVLKKDGSSTLWIRRLPQDSQAPQSSDLAILPHLEASVVFPGLAKSPEQSSDVVYDPLTGKLEASFAPNTKLVFEHLAVEEAGIPDLTSPSTSLLAPTKVLTGFLSKNSRQYAVVNVQWVGGDLAGTGSANGSDDLPPQSFLGLYSPAKNAALLPVVATLEYLGGETNNSGDKPFSNFPKMRLKISACAANKSFVQTSLDLDSLDHLSQQATFKPQDANGSQLRLEYGERWHSIAGRFLSNTSSHGDFSDTDGKLLLSSVPQLQAKGCDQAQQAVQTNEAIRALATASGLDLSSPRASSTSPDQPASDVSWQNSVYKGIATRASSSIPISVAFSPRRNPSGSSEDPALQVLLRIGYFGGVKLASEPAYFDWASGKIVAIFKKSGGGNLEFRTTLKDRTLDDATLSGPNLGTLPLSLDATVADPFSDAKEYKMTTRIAPREGRGQGWVLDGALSVKRLPDDLPSPANIDLPFVPALEVALRLNGSAQTPEAAQKVIYDPITGQMDVQFTDSTRMTLHNLTGASGDRSSRGDAVMHGELALASRVVADITASFVAGNVDLANLPPTVYVGTFKGSPTGSSFRAVAYFDYLNTAGNNTPEFVFLAFPKLRLNLSLCDGHDAFAKKTLDLVGFDHLGLVAQLRSIASNDTTQLEMTFSNDFSSAQGTFLTSDAGNGGRPSAPQLKLTARSSSSSRGCE